MPAIEKPLAPQREKVRRKRLLENQQMMRDKIDGAKYIRELDEIGNKLITVEKEYLSIGLDDLRLAEMEDVEARKLLRKQLAARRRHQSDIIQVLRERSSLNFRKLKFVLPELKAVEVTADESTNAFAKALSEALNMEETGDVSENRTLN